MPTLAANLLNDAADSTAAPKRRTKSKAKSVTLGKGGPGSGPQGGRNLTPEQHIAIKASSKAASATEKAKTATQHAIAFGLHEKAAAASARAGNSDASAMHERAAGFHKSEAVRLSTR